MEVDNNDVIYMKAYSERGMSDWYGDYNYLDNPLDRYKSVSKLWESKCYDGSGCHGFGIELIVVKTTLTALKTMGWENDYERYKCTEQEFE